MKQLTTHMSVVYRVLYALLLTVGVSQTASSQVIIDQQNFTTSTIPAGWVQNDLTAGSSLVFDTTDSYLISPEYNLSGYSNVKLTFHVAKDGTAGTDGPLTISISNDGGATWTAQTFNSITPTTEVFTNFGPTTITVSGSIKIKFSRENSPSKKKIKKYKLEGTPIPAATISGTLAETSLNGASFTASLVNTTYVASLDASFFALSNVPLGVSIASVVKNSDTQATITLDYNNYDFDADYDFSLSIGANQLSSSAILNSNSLTITAQNEYITINPVVSTGIDYYVGEGPSEAVQFDILAADLMPGDGTVTITGTSSYEVSSTSSTSGYSTSATIDYSNSALSSYTFWVRLKAGLNQGSYLSQTILVSGGKANKSLSVSGSVTGPEGSNDLCSNATTLTVDAGSQSSSLAGATYTSLENSSEKDVWFTFTASCYATYHITTSGFSGDVDTFLFAGACPTNNSDNITTAETYNTEEVMSASLQAGTYTIRVAAMDVSAENNFSINVTREEGTLLVAQGSVGSIAWNSAEIKGPAETACGITAYGFEYSTVDGFLPGEGTYVTCSAETGGVFTYNLTGLFDEVTYYFICWEEIEGEIMYGPQQSFVTAYADLGYLAPSATSATNAAEITSSKFKANWDEMAAVENYRLDVSETENFETVLVTENFAAFTTASGPDRTASLTTYMQEDGWTGNNVYEENGYVKLGSDSATGQLTTPGIDFTGEVAVQFDAMMYNNLNAVVQLYIKEGSDWVQVGPDLKLTDSFTTYTIPVSGESSTTNLRITSRQDLSGKQFLLDNFSVYRYNALTGYTNISVNNTTATITGLSANTPYFYRVRTEQNGIYSVNSDVTSLSTREVNIWNGVTWSLGSEPTSEQEAEIQGDYSTSEQGLFTANNLVITSGIFTVASGTTFTLPEGVINNSTAQSFVVQNNGNFIQVNDVDNEGDIIVLRNGNPLYRLDYTMWSSPVSGQNLLDFSPVTLTNRFYTYNTAGTNYTHIEPESNEFQPGQGYLIRMPNGYSPQSYPGYNEGTLSIPFNGTFTGTPLNGNVIVNISGDGEGYNMIGNPYPSPINVTGFFNGNSTKIDGTLWIWRKTNNPDASSYITMNSAGIYVGNGQENATDDDDPNGIIRQGQGFFVQRSGGTATQITFTNSMRTDDVENNFFRTSGTANGETQNSSIRLNIKSNDANIGQLYVGYREGATNNADNGLDAKHINDGAVVMASLLNEKPYIIQCRALPFEATDIVYLHFATQNGGTYTYSLGAVEGLFANGQEVYINDALTGAVHNLSESDYTFDCEAGTFTNRFSIVYMPNALDTDTPDALTNGITAWVANKAITVASNGTAITAVNLYDINGRLLYSQNKLNTQRVHIEKPEIQQQVVLLHISTDKGTVTKKLIL